MLSIKDFVGKSKTKVSKKSYLQKGLNLGVLLVYSDAFLSGIPCKSETFEILKKFIFYRFSPNVNLCINRSEIKYPSINTC